MFCVSLLMDPLFDSVENCLVKQFAICLGVFAILLVHIIYAQHNI